MCVDFVFKRPLPATGWTTGVRFLAETDVFLNCHVQTGSGARPSFRPLELGGRFLGRKADRTLSSGAEKKRQWRSYTLHFPIRFHAVVRSQYQEQRCPFFILPCSDINVYVP